MQFEALSRPKDLGMNIPPELFSNSDLIDTTKVEEVNGSDTDPVLLNESAAFLLRKVTWDKVIESGRCAELNGAEFNPTFTLLPEEFGTPFAMNAALKHEQCASVSTAFDEFIAAEQSAFDIALQDQPCAPGR